ncbi:MAG TPA: thiamine ABC transporter substrate-binding protein [Ilumatobacteraceae bacterium]|nr:thiamine ABC transporter substrate-binding protein [Ilumatobacteraceae bacterium]HRB05029.1 thiamine ABC transporter substrate-binding protein [Ilumatobacteraceae bacterium]
MKRVVFAGLAAAALLVACGNDDNTSSVSPAAVTLVTYDSFPTKGTPLNEALAAFTADTGIAVQIVTAGDAGTMVTKAVLTAGNPEGDVMWGVDNTLLSAATDGRVFEGDPSEVDFGDVCVNYDIAWFAEHGMEPPTTMDDLLLAEYKGLLVVENPATSSPGLAFLMATIAHTGEDTWQQYWTALRANGVEVVDSWDSAYYERFSGAAGSAGDKPLVVSYGSSPPAEVVFADPPRDDAPTGVIGSTCFRQTEYAGVLRGTRHPDEAARLAAFLLSEPFQKELPLTLFVYPINPSVTLPEVFTKYAVLPANPFTFDSATIAAHRQQWQDQWTEIVLR